MKGNSIEAPQKSRRPRKRGRRSAKINSASPSGSGQWLYGAHAVRAALANPERVCRRLLLTDEAAKTMQTSLPAGAPTPERAARQDISALLPPDAVHQGIAVLADPLAEIDLDDILRAVESRPSATLLVLDQVSDPRNVGAALRAAAAFAAAAVILPARRAPEASAALAKAASGALERVPLVHVTNLARALDQMRDAGFTCIGLDGNAEHTLADSEFGDRLALVLGSEDRGLRRLTRERCDTLARIPISAGMESLNVSAAAAIALYECARRRDS